MEPNFIQPRYDSNGFAGIPQRISEKLGSGKYDAVVLFLIDGFGWRFFEKFQQEVFLERIIKQGNVEKLTSQFPSTTAAHMTTIHSGMPVGEHGVFEWYFYEPTLDEVIAPLLFSYAGTSQRDTLKPSGIIAKQLFPKTNIYRTFKQQGIQASVFQHREYTPSTYSDILFKGAKSIGFRTLPEALVNLASELKEIERPAYYFLYFDRIDGIGHEYGPESDQITAEITNFLMTMETVFTGAMQGNKKRILFMLSADHGQVETDPEASIYLNRDPSFHGIEKFLRLNHAGEPIVPAGSARDFFLYVKPEALDEADDFLARRLAGKAEVRKVKEMISEGYFGPSISAQFHSRVGDLVILPYGGEAVWWYEQNKFEQKFRGHHGGLTKQEMEIPLLSWEL
jgi:predicted AlkP superfamily pyrophosphatase or phosphodiesterase